MLRLARPIRPRRVGEWTEPKAVTFIVTLAASRSVTLAARQAGMSRKAAYELKRRDAGFAAVWNAALVAAQAIHERPALNRVEGDDVDEVYDPRGDAHEGYNNLRSLDHLMDKEMRQIFFSSIANQADGSSSRLRNNGHFGRREDKVAPRAALP